jgi:DNA replication protein DnaC
MNNTGTAKKAGEIIPSLQYLPEQDIECPKHGVYRGRPFKGFWAFGHENHITNPECPKCEKEREAKEKEKEAQWQRVREINRMKAMNISKKFWDTSFENFNAYSDELRHHLAVTKKFAENPDGKLVMLGENGNGKNHLATSILKKTGGLIYTCYEIGVMLRDCYNGISSEMELLERLCTTSLLIIDEVEKAKDSDAKHNWMSHIVNKRYENMLPIIFIANCHSMADCKESSKPCPKCIEYSLENDILSRVLEDGILLKFTGADYRQRLGDEYRNKKKVQNA